MEELCFETNLGYSVMITFTKADELHYFIEWANKSKNVKTKIKLIKHCYKLMDKKNFITGKVEKI